MKKFKILFVLFSGIFLMNACLGEGSHVVEYGAQPGVASFDGDEMFIYIKNGERILPSNRTTSLGEQECVLINYKVDLDDYKGDGFYSVELTSAPTIVKSHEMVELPRIAEPDTLLNERLINNFYSNTAFIQNKLFLYPSFTISDSLSIHNFYKLSYEKDQVPMQDTTLNNIDVYMLYLRVQLDSTITATRTGEKSKVDINAFDIKEFVDYFAPKVPTDSSNMYVRIRYARSFNSDSTQVNFGETSSFAIPFR